MKKKEKPAFIFVAEKVIGSRLINVGILQDSDGNKIRKTKKYNCE